VTIFASSSVNVSSVTLLCTFIFFLWPASCNPVLFINSVSVCVVVFCISMSGTSPPPSSSYVVASTSLCAPPLLSFYYIPPFLTAAQSFSRDKVFGIFFFQGFLTVVLPLVSFEHSTTFLVFVVGLFVFFDVPDFSCFLPFDPFSDTTSTFHSSGQSFMAHFTSYAITQYLIYNQFFLVSILA
jgi:hypothetical protein